MNLTLNNIKHKTFIFPLFCALSMENMYENNCFTKLYVNERIYATLSNLGMKENDINSFLHMYNEDKKLAVWTLNKNAKVFNIKNPKHGITLRKVKISATPILQSSHDKTI